MEDSPVTVTELLKLTQVGIPLEHITWPRVTMTSDQWICIRHGKPSRTPAVRNSYVTLLNPCRADFPQSWHLTVGSVSVNPNPLRPLMATKAGKHFKVYNLDSRQVVYRTRVNSKIFFWCWIRGNIIAMVTDKAVYHWDLSKEDSLPQFVFTRHARLRSADIVNYAVDVNMNWHALVGLAIEDDRICGISQIYSAEHDLSQPIEAHAVSFGQYVLPGNQHPSTLLVAVVRELGNSGKVHIIELGPHAPGNQAPTRHSGDLVFEDNWEKYNFPVSVQISIKLGLVFIVTKYGQLHLCDLESGQLLSTSRICADVLFVAALTTDGQGLLTISRNGQVLLVNVKNNHIAQYVRYSLQRPVIADRLEKVLANLCQLNLLGT